MSKKINMVGQRWGILTVVAEAGRKKHWVTWLCRCDCGQMTIVPGALLRYGNTKSCGCQKYRGLPDRTTHGMSLVNGKRTPLHALWLRIRTRCNHPGHKDYKYYGGRGISVCARWDDFAVFVGDVGPWPGKGWTLDRIDNNGDYEPSNVRWATRETQARNRNYCKIDATDAAAIRREYKLGLSQIKLAKKYGITQSHVSHIILGRVWT